MQTKQKKVSYPNRVVDPREKIRLTDDYFPGFEFLFIAPLPCIETL